MKSEKKIAQKDNFVNVPPETGEREMDEMKTWPCTGVTRKGKDKL